MTQLSFKEGVRIFIAVSLSLSINHQLYNIHPNLLFMHHLLEVYPSIYHMQICGYFFGDEW